MAAPPPYESVLADANGGDCLFASSSFRQPEPGAQAMQEEAEPMLRITVTEPAKQGEGISAFVSFMVVTRYREPGCPARDVMRRYSHFAWLHEQLTARYKGCIVPSLPEKSVAQKFQLKADFITMRMRALEVFLNKVAAHPMLKDSPAFRQFLEASDHEWSVEMARWQAEANASKPPAVNGALAWLKSLQHTAQNMVTGRSDDALEDAEYLKVRDYINSLETHLVEAHRQAARLVRKEADLSTALTEFGVAAEQLGKHDADGSVHAAMDVLCARSGQIGAASRQRADALALEFEAPFKEFARTIKSVQVAMADRASALSLYSQAKSELESRKARLAKVRGTPGLKEEKISEAEADVADAEQRVRSAKVSYDGIVATMTEELNRWQKERANEMRTMLQRFARAQAMSAAENAAQWSSLQLEASHSAAHGMTGQGVAVS
mmetsp:Transcript_17343/g.29662  ORF Transcript_17343/g.29662 Transcript_17343/m.29662 type:complete len:437 (-) Transcript_17343:572-1882(-)